MFQIFEGIRFVWNLISSRITNTSFSTFKFPSFDKMNVIVVIVILCSIFYVEFNKEVKENKENQLIIKELKNELIVKDNSINNLITKNLLLKQEINNTQFEKEIEIKYNNLRNSFKEINKQPMLFINKISESNNSNKSINKHRNTSEQIPSTVQTLHNILENSKNNDQYELIIK